MSFIARRRGEQIAQIEPDILRGEDDTEVSWNENNWHLAKTLGLYATSIEKPVDKVVYEVKRTSLLYVGMIRITYIADYGTENTILPDWMIPTDTYRVYTTAVSPPIYADVILQILVYLRGYDSVRMAYNRLFKAYGFNRLMFEY